MGLFSSKKGLDYAVLLVVIVFITVGALYGQISQQRVADKELGDVQTPLLQSNANARLLEVYMRESAKFSIEEAKQKLTYPSCIVLNSREVPEKVSSLLPIIEDKFTESFDAYLARYESEKNKRAPGWQIPKQSLSLAVSDSNIIGVYEKPVRIPLTDPVGKNIGLISLRPSFEVQSDAFKALSSGFKEVETIASSCSSSSNLVECISSKTQLRVEQEGELYRFIANDNSFCLSLYFPVNV